MSVVPLQVLFSVVLVAGSILLLAYSIRHRDHEHADRLSLLPLDDDAAPAAKTPETQAIASPPAPTEGR